MKIIIAVFFLLILAVQNIFNRYRKAGIGEAPLFYTSQTALFIGNISFLLTVITFGAMLYVYGWKFALGILLLAFVSEALIIVPIVEKIVQNLFKSISQN